MAASVGCLRRGGPECDARRRALAHWGPSTTRAITIDAKPRDVFPWLLQIGYGRGGWYSYDWIDNDGKRSVDRIDPAPLQELVVGDRVKMLPGFGPTVREIEHDHHILSSGEADTWCLLVEPRPGGCTRLISRWRLDRPKSIGTYVWTLIADPGAFVMEQKMLRTIRALAERNANELSTMNDSSHDRNDQLGIFMAIGRGTGMVIGLAVAACPGLALGVAFGAAAGVVVGSAYQAIRHR